MKHSSIFFIILIFLPIFSFAHPKGVNGGSPNDTPGLGGLSTEKTQKLAADEAAKRMIQNKDVSDMARAFQAEVENETKVSSEDEFFETEENAEIKIMNGKPVLTQGFTEAGKNEFLKQREIFQNLDKQFNKIFFGLEAIYDTLRIAAIGEMFLMVMGEPGAAKSALLEWFYKAKEFMEDVFSIQLHQMATPADIIGGLKYNLAEEGIIEYNHEGSMIEKPYFIIDEPNNANPATMGSLLQLTDNNRTYKGGRYQRQSVIRSGAFTTNASLTQFLEFLEKGGQGAAGPALLNRLHLKVAMHNWLKLEDQIRLNKLYAYKRSLSAFSSSKQKELLAKYLETEKNAEGQNWQNLNRLAHGMFHLDEATELILTEMANIYYDEISKVMKETEVAHKKDSSKELYEPATRPTERIREFLFKVVIISAFVDFLKSDFSAPENIEVINERMKEFGPIRLSPLSTWRVAHILTTNFSGESTRLDLKGDRAKIVYSTALATAKTQSLSLKQENLAQVYIDERQRFSEIYETKVAEYFQHVKEVADIVLLEIANTQADFELVLERYREQP